MANATNEDEARTKVREMLEKVGVVMFVTTMPDGTQHARPMAIQKVEGDTVWFFHVAGTPKAQEIRQDSDVLLAASNPSSQDYVSAKGKARTSKDTAKAKALWSESARVWFPKGAEDPELELIAVSITGAEYWDSPSSTALHAYGYVKALATGERPAGGENKKVSF
ncbi:pyridoxamine 5'-phosphate oxidase family protein [Sabulicella glaciei]|uniref:Pyridoxamine 5'-phosphate oxidase family protein n=1 Tax=Sabulicella glaciei TaxID=2984948 RepID=A0ABT3NV91_9PROT|nr:pyridoxamine 5'-phosphate oxidase family protein [Roseococcus sp. MDT2-1-1]MCW8086077.1 pyridoxamine 5'-phosphate oxidase family protein [Roseococcus sp. MDT2-1-1]